jgi:hypothetical protein
VTGKAPFLQPTGKAFVPLAVHDIVQKGRPGEMPVAAFQKVLGGQVADLHIVTLDARQGNLVVDQRDGHRGDAR